MFNKKIIFTTIATSLVSFSISAYANLITYNNTNEYSTVNITSTTPKRCAGIIGKYTNPHGVLDVTDTEVKTLCMGSKGPCKADIYLSKDCSGTVAAKAALNLTNMSVTIESVLNPKYSFRADGSKFYINYA